MKKNLGLLLALFLVLANPLTGLAKDIEITLDGKPVVSDVAPIIVEDRTLVPIRFISENLGYQVNWDGQQRQVDIRGNKTISLKIEDKSMKVGQDVVLLDVAPRIIQDRTMVPLRAISEAFGLFVDWDQDNRRVILKTKDLSHLNPEEKTYFLSLQKQFQGFHNNIRLLQVTVGQDMSVTSKEDTLSKLDSIQKDFEHEITKTEALSPPEKFKNVHLLYLKSLKMAPEIVNGYKASYIGSDDKAATSVLSKFFHLQTQVNEINRAIDAIQANREYTMSEEFKIYQKEKNLADSTNLLSNPSLLQLINKL